MEPKKPITDAQKGKSTENNSKDENEIVANVEQIVDKESFSDRNHSRKHDSPIRSRTPKASK